jgi:hypothetical protein
MSLLEKTYIQKSSLFLLPLLGIKRQKYYRLDNTYISDPSQDITSDDMYLITAYPKGYKDFEEFEYKLLLSNKHFDKYYETNAHHVYIFDMAEYWSGDFKKFLRWEIFKIFHKSKTTHNGL